MAKDIGYLIAELRPANPHLYQALKTLNDAVNSGVGVIKDLVLTGNVDGINDTFVVPSSGTFVLFVNGIKQDPKQYTISGFTVTFNADSIPTAGSLVTALVF